MLRHAFIGSCVITTLLAGCQNPPKKVETPAPHAMTEDQVSAMRDSYQRVSPDVQVGVVQAVESNSNLASVGDVPLKDFKPGQIITFMDANKNTVAMGTVDSIDPSAGVVVRYTVQPGGRAPQKGDVAIRASK